MAVRSRHIAGTVLVAIFATALTACGGSQLVADIGDAPRGDAERGAKEVAPTVAAPPAESFAMTPPEGFQRSSPLPQRVMVEPRTYSRVDVSNGRLLGGPEEGQPGTAAELVPILSQVFFKDEGATREAMASAVDGKFVESDADVISMRHIAVEVELAKNLPPELLDAQFGVERLDEASAAKPLLEFSEPNQLSRYASWFDGTNLVTFMGEGVSESQFRDAIASFKIEGKS